MLMAPQKPAQSPQLDAARGKPGGWLLALTALAVVLVVISVGVAGIVLRVERNAETMQTMPDGLPQPSGLVDASLRVTPDPVLAAAAATLLAHPPAEASGRYNHIWLEMWSSDLAVAEPGSAGVASVRPERRQTWYDAGTRRLYEQTLRLPPIPAATFQPAETIGRTDFGRGEFADSLSTVPAETLQPPAPDQPAAMLDRMMREDGSMPSVNGAVEHIETIYRDTYPRVAVRAAALNALASIEGLLVDPAAVDWLGRRGISITGVGRDGSYATIIVNPTDGMLLASSTRFGGPGPALTSWTLYLGNTRTDQRPKIRD